MVLKRLYHVCLLVGGFKHFLFSRIFGGVFPTDSYFSGGFKPPTSLLFDVAFSVPHFSELVFVEVLCHGIINIFSYTLGVLLSHDRSWPTGMVFVRQVEVS